MTVRVTVFGQCFFLVNLYLVLSLTDHVNSMFPVNFGSTFQKIRITLGGPFYLQGIAWTKSMDVTALSDSLQAAEKVFESTAAAQAAYSSCQIASSICKPTAPFVGMTET